jgi:hypothetical protein
MMFGLPNMLANSPMNGAIIAMPGKINKNGIPNDLAFDAGLKQCIVMIPVNRMSTAFTIA